MEPNSEGENPNKNSKNMSNSIDGGSTSKPKRQMKTPLQLKTLEKAYALETYPSEATRAELSEKLGLTDRQLQMWFCHRRLKDKRESSAAQKPRKATVTVLAEAVLESPVDEAEPGSDYGSRSGSGSGSSPFMDSRKVSLDDVPLSRMCYESSPQSIMELRAIACVEAQLGEPLREDGPVLGVEFDPLPPDSFGAPMGVRNAIVEQQKLSGHPYDSKAYERRDAKSSKASARVLHDYQFVQEHSSLRSDSYGQPAQSHFLEFPPDDPRGRTSVVHGKEPSLRVHGAQGHAARVHVLSQQDKPGHMFSSPYGDDDSLLQGDSFTINRINVQSTNYPILGSEEPYVLADGQNLNDDADLRMERKRKSEEAGLGREGEGNENRNRKEHEKQDIRRRKNEERMKKEMEKQERERRKEEERFLREKQREEERSLREQRREIERREKFLQKEVLKAEKRRQKEELRREKEAVRRKVAIEKATARKIAKESMDLIEDEQLELMELAASSKGLSSIIHLGHDTLQNLESFRDSLVVFPPKSVQLKKPFAVQPWIDSEENIGNLLMVWRFLITFADILGLWPFTLDEFVQAFHDYDSRLMGEIHVTLLKLVIKDIEDVARTPSTVLGMNQYSTANPEGGHPQIVEGAYAWGFDIRNWQRHLNQLTWPEVFRQLALSAGFGPQLKKRSISRRYFGDKNEGKGCEDVISALRNGSAAENTFTLMREKGMLLPRRSRHRLTPGTVKFAAFHVLSLEGGEGLTVIELADKIQKSGLRDLTTSKTPEASISVALTRDAKLFERVAPSTYCVRAAYRKDPADAESILAAARKKIRIFENGFVSAGADDADDVERDDDFECDVDEDPEVDDFATPLSVNKISNHHGEVMNTCTGIAKDNICSGIALNAENEFGKNPSSFPIKDIKAANGSSTADLYAACEVIGPSSHNQEKIEIDESKSCESWIQGLTEGEYSYLSVEERLNALVALIGVSNEGNTIRAALEERLEAANALKKQMWAEAQLDKSRLREDIGKLDFSNSLGSKPEAQLASTAVGGGQSPLPVVFDNKNNEASPSSAAEQKPIVVSQNVNNHVNSLPTEDNFSTQQNGYASKRSRSQVKSYIAHRAEETYAYRSLPLGQDRRRNRYWQFVASASSNDPCSGRIFVELHGGNWRLIDSEEAFDALITSLDTRGIRESHLRIMLQKIETSFKENAQRNLQCANVIGRSNTNVKIEAAEMDSSPDWPASFDSPGSVVCGLNSDTAETVCCFKIELGGNELEKKGALKRYQDFQRWIWKECFTSSTLCAMKYGKTRCTQLLTICDLCLNLYLSQHNHCLSCHLTFDSVSNNFNFSDHAIQCKGKKKVDLWEHVFDSSPPLPVRLLKAMLAFIEVSVPPEALESSWVQDCRKTWGNKLNESSSPEELLKLLTQLECIIKRNYLSSYFETTKELLSSSSLSGSAHNSADPTSLPILPWIPQTTAAVALRLLELDASVMYTQKEETEPLEDKEVRDYMRLPSGYNPLKSKEIEVKELDLVEHTREVNYADLGGRRINFKRGRGGRDQGSSRWQRRVPSSSFDSSRRNARDNENLDLRPRQQGRRTNGQGRGRGRRTVRRRPEKRAVGGTFLGNMGNIDRPRGNGQPPRNLIEEWEGDKFRIMHMEAADNGDSAEEVESDDNAQEAGYEQRNWEVGFEGPSSRWNRDSMEMSDDDADASGDDNDNAMEELGDEDSEGDIYMSEESDGIPNKIGKEGIESELSDDYSE
ncbi:Homeobox domain-containing protein/DDT domain-containing protein [Cephalotus follicularis]|uniref:Homeobox domain-containing protein/DDT domain-containing protein n=1 Tax=Cephalotus follicularis TaxID=3775 RepID=A0A1Q3AXQ1_CEPFO|nr:Homeobox domain-containing protein/DDT domain-containing protein [Cephalotus follicularis]